ncbi:response regulator [Candidatus Saccharibacteria bacterium]|nr:response regulator [Candidatus Saccharibacteria bacterium]
MKKQASIVVIDDEQWLTTQYVRVLQKAGFIVHAAHDALEGLDAIDKYHPQVIVLDVFMPGPNGFVLLHEIRSHSDLAHIPVILCSNSASDIPHGNLNEYGVATVLDKTTMSPDDIATAVRRLLP